MSNYFGHKPQDWERSMMRASHDGTVQSKEMQRAVANPEEYTTARPNMSSKAAFTVGSMKGAGRDGLTRGENTHYYKIEKSNSDDADPTPTSESTSEPSPAPTPERAEAKERAQNFKANINAEEGIDFSSDDPNEEDSKSKYQLNLLQQQVSGS